MNTQRYGLKTYSVGDLLAVKDFYYTEDVNEIKDAIEKYASLKKVLISNSNGINRKSTHRTPVFRKGACFVRYRKGYERVIGYITLRHTNMPETVDLFWLII
jgi:hypothetical protein